MPKNRRLPVGWRGYDSQENRQTAFELSRCIGMVCRALAWHRMTSPLKPTRKKEYADAVPGWLQELLGYFEGDPRSLY